MRETKCSERKKYIVFDMYYTYISAMETHINVN